MKKIILTLLTLILTLPNYLSTPRVLKAMDDFTNYNVKTDYDHYLEKYDKAYPNDTIKISGINYSEFTQYADEDVEIIIDEESNKTGVLIPEEGQISWDFFVAKEGYYNLKIDYFPTMGRSSPISRALLINNELPFSLASSITLQRLFKDAFNVTERRDISKSDIRPSLIEAPRWISKVIYDIEGYYNQPLYFHLQQGMNRITLVGEKEPLLLESLTLFQQEKIPTYEEVLRKYNELNLKTIDKLPQVITVEGEDAVEKSSPTLAPIESRVSILNSPFDFTKIRMNAIGGYNWRVNGDFITWEVDVPEEGLYHINFKVLQNFARGNSSYRRLYINDKVPFIEVNSLEFKYDSDLYYAFNENNNYLFHLKEGINTIKLEAIIGKYAEYVNKVDTIISNLNYLYRNIVKITSVNPDPYQDYLLDKRIPTLKHDLKSNYELLDDVISSITSVNAHSDKIAPLTKMSYQLKDFYQNIRQIQSRLRNFKENLSSLGTWLLTAKDQPLTIDYLVISGTDNKLKRVKTNFFEKVYKEIMSFYYSFFTDSTLLGSGNKENETIEVWITSGRDQANLLRQMIDEEFTPFENINVNLKLVSGSVLLPATVTKTGPDVALGIGEDLPVNWAIRHAVSDLSKMEGFNEVKTRFNDSALTPYTYKDGVYALPDTQNILVMFYRKDILQDLEITLPTTWDEVIGIVPTLQRNNLEFYFPSIATASLNPLLYSMIIQNDGNLYDESGRNTTLFSEESMEAFVRYSRFYTDYQFVTNANFVNRFRSGEMPIGISYYSDYNTLSVFAPEIRGLWGFAHLPGTLNGTTLNNSGISTTSGSIILETSKHKDASWKFLKWWTSKDAQINYARGMEGILGAAARYHTANKEALAMLPWSSKDYQVLKQQFDKSVGLPIVPGSYITGRNVDNAFRLVLNKNMNPREVLFDYAKKINNELERKRKELGID